jgi:hypothetical protein
LFRDGQFYSARGGGKTTDLPQVTDILYDIPINNSQAIVDEQLNPHMTVDENKMG